MSEILLEVKGLKQYFISGRGKKKVFVKAVDDISFHINKGETFGLVGESGCGKTTTGRTIIRLYDPTEGEVILDGEMMTGKMTKDLRKTLSSNIAMIFQDPVSSLNPRMTIKEIIGEGLKVKGIKDSEVIDQKVYEMLDKVGLTKDHASRYPHEFSGGQRQRIGIARALIIEPKLIIADEPISALDVSIQAQVINLLNDLKEKMDLTIMFIAHDLSVVKYFSDRVGVMFRGKIVEMAKSDLIYENPIHPYTKSLLSAVPQPDPVKEKNRELIEFDVKKYDEGVDDGTLIEVKPEHFVYGSKEQLKEYLINE